VRWRLLSAIAVPLGRRRAHLWLVPIPNRAVQFGGPLEENPRTQNAGISAYRRAVPRAVIEHALPALSNPVRHGRFLSVKIMLSLGAGDPLHKPQAAQGEGSVETQRFSARVQIKRQGVMHTPDWV